MPHIVKQEPALKSSNAFLELLDVARARSSRPFLARGIAIKRCGRCQLAQSLCICQWRVSCSSQLDIVLIMHHDEIFKPTNTGRLIADVLPANTWVYEWSRTNPPKALMEMLSDANRHCLLIFPALAESAQVYDPLEPTQNTQQQGIPDPRRKTLFVLDGTWRQAGKMYRQSHWLQKLHHLSLPACELASYQVRKAPKAGQYSTAEAVAAALKLCGDDAAAGVVKDYFTVFNQHYVASRQNICAAESDAHQRLAAVKTLGEAATC